MNLTQRGHGQWFFFEVIESLPKGGWGFAFHLGESEQDIDAEIEIDVREALLRDAGITTTSTEDRA